MGGDLEEREECHAELTRLRGLVRELRSGEAEDIKGFRRAVQEEVDEKNHRIARLEARVDNLSLENRELRLLLSRAEGNLADCNKETALLKRTCSCGRQTQQLTAKTQPPPMQHHHHHHHHHHHQLLRGLRARIGQLQGITDSLEHALEVHTSAENAYVDESTDTIDAEALTVGCQPDPVCVGHAVTVTIITRNSHGRPCRGASASEFEVKGLGDVESLTPVKGERCCFRLTFVPKEVGRCGVSVHFRGHTVSCTTSSVAGEGVPDPRQTTILLSPNPVQAGGVVTGTVVTKDSQGLVTPLTPLSNFTVSPTGGASNLTPLKAVHGIPSQARFEFVAPSSGRCGVTVAHMGASKSASIEVLDTPTPPISAPHTAISCTPCPARVGETVTVWVTTRSANLVPTGGASVEDLRNLRQVGSISNLAPFTAVSPSTFKTTFVPTKDGTAGIAVSPMGHTLYCTTVVAGDSHGTIDLRRTTMSIAKSPLPVSVPSKMVITARDQWGAHCSCGAEDDWQLRPAEGSHVSVKSLCRTSRCVLQAEVVAHSQGRHCVELFHRGKLVARSSFTAAAKQEWSPPHTKLSVTRDSGGTGDSDEDDCIPITSLDVAVLTISTLSSSNAPAVGPPPDAFDVTVSAGAATSAVLQVEPEKYKCYLSGFPDSMSSSTVTVKVTVAGHVLSTSFKLGPSAVACDPSCTRVVCHPDTVMVGDTVTASISFWDRNGLPAPSPNTSDLSLEPIGQIARLTRVTPTDARVCTSSLEVVFVAEAPGVAGLVVRHGDHSCESTVAVVSFASSVSGPCSLPHSDVAVIPDPVRPGHSVQCYVTVRDSRGAPLEGVPIQPLSIVLYPLQNTLNVSSKVTPVPGCQSSWVINFTAGRRQGTTGVKVEINGHVFYATATVEEAALDPLDDELIRLKELTTRLVEDTRHLEHQHSVVSPDSYSSSTAHTVSQGVHGGMRTPLPSLSPGHDTSPATTPPHSSRGEHRSLSLNWAERDRPEAITRRSYSAAVEKPKRSLFPDFGLEVTDGIKFYKTLGARFEYDGVKVVAAKGAAYHAGIRAEDLITHVEGDTVTCLFEFREAIRGSQPGKPVSLRVRCNDTDKDRTVTVVPDKSLLPADQRPSYTRTVRVPASEVGLTPEDIAARLSTSPTREHRSPSVDVGAEEPRSMRPPSPRPVVPSPSRLPPSPRPSTSPHGRPISPRPSRGSMPTS